MEKSKIDQTVRLSRIINEMDKESFQLLCRQFNDQRKSEMEYEVFLNHARDKLNNELKKNKISLDEIKSQLKIIINTAYDIGNEADILYRINGYADNVKKEFKGGYRE